ncbi:efflux transporter outer membrane subunit [Thermodesulfovibrio yellowstonii]|nr:efflux transporter outer membrane subunit [Thermodesulfovibrio islandicus]
MIFFRDSFTFKIIFIFCYFFIFLLLYGCFPMEKNHISPEISFSNEWNNNKMIDMQINNDTENLAKWWESFNDKTLSQLIEIAIENNLDLKQAQARIKEAKARREVAGAKLFPSIDAKSSANYSKTRGTKIEDNTAEHLYSVGIDASWEADIFGGKRKSLEAYQAEFEASQWDFKATIVSLISEVALNYIELKTYQNRIEIAEKNLNSQTETYNLTKWKYMAGLNDAIDVTQAEYSMENTRAQLPSLRTAIEEKINTIAVLLGKQPQQISEELKKSHTKPLISEKISLRIPADVLKMRPDIRKAERQLAAQSARVDEAIAGFYPKFTLSGSFGIEALSLNSLVKAATKIITGDFLISLPIFHADEIRQNVEIQTALQEQALLNYEATVLNAIKEVENALVAYAEEQKRKQALEKAVEASQLSFASALQKYEVGLTDFSTVLETQRSLLNLQDQLEQSKGNIFIYLIKLYKAFGGGWESFANEEEN